MASILARIRHSSSGASGTPAPAELYVYYVIRNVEDTVFVELLVFVKFVLCLSSRILK